MLVNPFRLARRGVLGMNQRNVEFVNRYNERRLYPFVDDKLKTKHLAEQADISVPQLYGVIRIHHQVADLPNLLRRHGEFVIKPSMGSEGKGILVIMGRRDGAFIKTNGATVSLTDVNRHVTNILSGLYSLGGRHDKAMIEYRVNFAPIFRRISYLGGPDIRVLVFLGYPVMAMLRLPTSMSDGKANLHQGAVGVGIDVGVGSTASGVCNGKPIRHHPDTGNQFEGLTIPKWYSLLQLAAGCYEMTGLGYFGTDIVLDEEHGPMLLELNARPGLSIQIANAAGLLPRLRKIEEMASERLEVEQRVQFVRHYFSQTFLGPKDLPKYLL